MGMNYTGEHNRGWEWNGSVRDLVRAVGDGDARLGYVRDIKSGARIAMNIDGSDDPEATEPFYIESPNGDNLYDARNRKEAISILSNIRKGIRDPDLPSDRTRKPRKKVPRRSRVDVVPTRLSGIRG